MATRPNPTDLPFATDAVFASDGDTWSGAANKVDPGNSREAEGFEPDTLPAEWLNWRLNLMGQATEWAVTLLDANEEHTYQAAKTRTILVPLWSALYTSGWSRATDPLTDHFLQSGTGDAVCVFPLGSVLRHGQVITGIKVILDPSNAEASTVDRMIVSLVSVTPNFTTFAVPAVTTHENATDDGTANRQTVSITVSPTVTVDHEGADAATEYYLCVNASNAALDDRIYAIQITVNDPGPRNF